MLRLFVYLSLSRFVLIFFCLVLRHVLWLIDSFARCTTVPPVPNIRKWGRNKPKRSKISSIHLSDRWWTKYPPSDVRWTQINQAQFVISLQLTSYVRRMHTMLSKSSMELSWPSGLSASEDREHPYWRFLREFESKFYPETPESWSSS